MGTAAWGQRRDGVFEVRHVVIQQRTAERMREAADSRLSRAFDSRRSLEAPVARATTAARVLLDLREALRPAGVSPHGVLMKIGALLTVLALAACSAATTEPKSSARGIDGSATPMQPAVGVAPTPTPVTTATSAPSAPRSASCTETANATGAGTGVTLYHDPKAMVDNQVELISAAGHRVLIDVGDPESLSRPTTADDILLTTHDPQYSDSWHEPDVNVLPEFVAAFPGRLLPMGASVTTGDFKVTGIAAAHGSRSGPATIVDSTDDIYVIEVGGVRIADFGDFGQPALTQKQLDRLGRVDVAITQFDNSYSGVDATNQLAFDMLDQICPRIVIPTALENSTVDMTAALSRMPGEYTPNDHVYLTPSTLPSKTTMLLLGTRATGLGKEFHLPLSKQ